MTLWCCTRRAKPIGSPHARTRRQSSSQYRPVGIESSRPTRRRSSLSPRSTRRSAAGTKTLRSSNSDLLRYQVPYVILSFVVNAYTTACDGTVAKRTCCPAPYFQLRHIYVRLARAARHLSRRDATPLFNTECDGCPISRLATFLKTVERLGFEHAGKRLEKFRRRLS